MKKYLALVLVLLLLVTGAACQKKEGTDGVILSETEITVEMYDQYTLRANAVNSSAAEFTWSSSDESVATVQEGVITGNGQGEARIRAAYGDVYAECTVTVIKNTNVPVLSLRESLELAQNSSFTLRPEVFFKGEEVQAAGYKWETSDAGVVTVTDGVVRAVAAGTAEVTCSVEAYGELLSASVAVTVKTGAALAFEEEAVTLYKPGTSGTPTSYTAHYKTIAAQGGEAENVVWSSDDKTVATVDQDGLIRAVGKGTTFVRISGLVDGEQQSAAISVNVTVPVVTMNEVVFDFDSKTGDVSGLEAAIGIVEGERIEKVSERTENGLVDYEYFEGSKTLVKSGAWQVGEKLWRVETSSAAYDIRAVVATRVLRNKEDILGMKRYDAAVMTEPDYYVLANDIDMEYADCPSLFVNGDSAGTIAWYGIFDGRGHAIVHASFLTAWVATAGFFGSIGANSVVKDLAFKDAAADGAYGIFASYIFGEVENIYIDCNAAKIGSSARVTGLFALEAKSTARIRNVVINYGEFTLWNNMAQCAFINNVSAGAEISDAYVVYFHATDPSLEKMFMQAAPQALIDYETVRTLRSVSDARAQDFADWDPEIWDLPQVDGKLPVLRAR